MTRIATCQACNFIIAGIKSRKAIQHTCGKTAREIMEFTIRHQHEKALKNVKSISEITGGEKK